VCNGPARAEGVRRGQRRRDAQARCPDLLLLDANPDRDARAFETVLGAVEALRPGVASLRPGLLAVRAPGRYFGNEENAAAVVAECLVGEGVWDCRFGVADDLFTAEQAARAADVQGWRIVAPGESASFLRTLPVEVLEGDGQPGREAASLLRRLGLTTLGDLAGLPADAVHQRFGRYGAQVWKRARGEDPSHFAPRTPPADLTAEIAFEPPLDSVEAVCFSVRTTAERFVADLAARQLVATGVRVEAEADGVVASARTWLHPRHFSSRDLIDRVHWQLQSAGGSLRSRHDAGQVRAPVERVRFVPETVEPSADHAEGLWGGGSDDLVERGVARVQAMVGFDAVRRPVLQGGRGPAARQASVTWGERGVELQPVDRPWPGRVPGPAPVRVFATPVTAQVLDGHERAVSVTERGVVSSPPCRFRIDPGERWEPVAAWAGPWPVDESWWSGGALVSRFQLVGADGRAWLLVCGGEGWHVEAAYD
ncbi:MAG: putative DNA-directed polymerase, partial [Nocardioidaceae bacterium]|nr:putative DNA-directed polymerase [Nocardioidaceae bacterium]